MNEILVKAPAKLNLHLQIISKRSDEFHDLRTLFTNIDLFDDLFFKITEEKVKLKETEPINDNLIFYDYGHLSFNGSIYVVKNIIAKYL